MSFLLHLLSWSKHHQFGQALEKIYKKLRLPLLLLR